MSKQVVDKALIALASLSLIGLVYFGHQFTAHWTALRSIVRP